MRGIRNIRNKRSEYTDSGVYKLLSTPDGVPTPISFLLFTSNISNGVYELQNITIHTVKYQM